MVKDNISQRKFCRLLEHLLVPPIVPGYGWPQIKTSRIRASRAKTAAESWYQDKQLHMHREMIVRDYMFMSASDLMSTINCMSADLENCIGKRAKLRHLIQPTR